MIAPINSRRAFTLLEIVVVLTILGLVASIVSVRFSGPLRRTRVQSAVQQWQSLDLFARQVNRTNDVTIELERYSGSTIVLLQRNGNEILRRWSVDVPLAIHLQSLSGDALDRVELPRGQGSLDYRLIVREGAYQEILEFAGGTGSVQHEKTKT